MGHFWIICVYGYKFLFQQTDTPTHELIFKKLYITGFKHFNL